MVARRFQTGAESNVGRLNCSAARVEKLSDDAVGLETTPRSSL